MISFYNTLGKVSMTGGYFAGLVSIAAQSGYGVAGLADSYSPVSFRTIIGRAAPDGGVKVTEEDGGLVIELHIRVVYGLNISAAVKSITHKVKYVVEDATGLTVKAIRVSVDDIMA